MTASLANLDDVKTLLSIDSDVVEYDDMFETLLVTATDMIQTALGRVFERSAVTEYHDTTDTRETNLQLHAYGEHPRFVTIRPAHIYLQRIPVQSADMEIWYDVNREYGDISKLNDDEFVLDHSSGRLSLFIPTIKAVRSVKIAYIGGYESDQGVLTSVPSELKLACTLQVAYMFGKVQTRSFNTVAQSNDGEVYNAPGLLLPEALHLARKYNRLKLGRG